MARFKLSDLNNKHFLSLAGNGVIAALGFVLMMLYARWLSLADTGIWFYFAVIYNLGDAVRNGFLGTATIKFYAGTSAERGREVLGSVWFLAMAVTAVLVVATLPFIPVIGNGANIELTTTIRWFGPTFISSLPFNLIFWVLVAEEKYGKILWLRLINSGSMILYIMVLILLKKMSLDALLWCNFLTNCLTSVVGLAWGLGKFRSFFSRSWACIMEVVHFGKYSLGSTAASKLFSSADSFIITSILGPAALAIYTVPLKLMELVEFILRSFVSTGMSGMAIAYNKNDIHQTTYIFKKYTGMLTLAFIPLTVFVMIFSDLIIHLIGGGKYVNTEAANIFRILMVLALSYPIDRFIGVTLDIIHKPIFNLYKVLIMLAFDVVGDLAGLTVFRSLYAVAFASFLVMASGIIFGKMTLNKYLKLPAVPDILRFGYVELKLLVRKVV